MSTSLSGSRSSISMSNTSMPANFWNSTPLPSMTGFDARAPIGPRPSTAVPFEITATRLARDVYRLAVLGSRTISSHAAATPGEYARDKSFCVTMDLVAVTLILPGRQLTVIVERLVLEFVGQGHVQRQGNGGDGEYHAGIMRPLQWSEPMIDLASDVKTRLTAAMRQAMAHAEVGDEPGRSRIRP